MSGSTIAIAERVALALVDVLEGVTLGAGYEVEVAQVDRPSRLEEYSPVSYGVALVGGDPEEDPDLEGAGSFKCWIHPFLIHLFLQVSDTESVPIESLVNDFRASIEKALRADPTLGGLATDLRIRSPESWIFKPNRSFEGATVNVEVHYRHQEDDPYHQ